MQDDEQPPSEQDRVEDWREHILIDAGFLADDAIELARRRDVDVHTAARLVADGCPVEVAVAILR